MFIFHYEISPIVEMTGMGNDRHFDDRRNLTEIVVGLKVEYYQFAMRFLMPRNDAMITERFLLSSKRRGDYGEN